MGTRGMVYVRHNKKTYCFFSHHDSYPSGLGMFILEWLYNLLKNHELNDFLNKWSLINKNAEIRLEGGNFEEVLSQINEIETEFYFEHMWNNYDREEHEYCYTIDFDTLKFQFINIFMIVDFKELFTDFDKLSEIFRNDGYDEDNPFSKNRDRYWFLQCIVDPEVDEPNVEINGEIYKRYITSEDEINDMYMANVEDKMNKIFDTFYV